MNRVIVISDVDGCLTDGKFVYTAEGKVAKVYGPHDADGVKLLKKIGIDIVFISADKRGFPITKKRIEDMKCPIFNVSEEERLGWIENYIKEKEAEYGCKTYSVFFGDGINDAKAASVVDCFIAPANARIEAKSVANYVTPSVGGNGAFLDLALFVKNNCVSE